MLTLPNPLRESAGKLSPLVEAMRVPRLTSFPEFFAKTGVGDMKPFLESTQFNGDGVRYEWARGNKRVALVAVAEDGNLYSTTTTMQVDNTLRFEFEGEPIKVKNIAFREHLSLLEACDPTVVFPLGKLAEAAEAFEFDYQPGQPDYEGLVETLNEEYDSAAVKKAQADCKAALTKADASKKSEDYETALDEIATLLRLVHAEPKLEAFANKVRDVQYDTQKLRDKARDTEKYGTASEKAARTRQKNANTAAVSNALRARGNAGASRRHESEDDEPAPVILESRFERLIAAGWKVIYAKPLANGQSIRVLTTNDKLTGHSFVGVDKHGDVVLDPLDYDTSAKIIKAAKSLTDIPKAVSVRTSHDSDRLFDKLMNVKQLAKAGVEEAAPPVASSPVPGKKYLAVLDNRLWTMELDKRKDFDQIEGWEFQWVDGPRKGKNDYQYGKTFYQCEYPDARGKFKKVRPGSAVSAAVKESIDVEEGHEELALMDAYQKVHTEYNSAKTKKPRKVALQAEGDKLRRELGRFDIKIEAGKEEPYELAFMKDGKTLRKISEMTTSGSVGGITVDVIGSATAKKKMAIGKLLIKKKMIESDGMSHPAALMLYITDDAPEILEFARDDDALRAMLDENEFMLALHDTAFDEEPLNEFKCNDEDLTRFAVTRKSVLINNIWWTIVKRDKAAGWFELETSEWAIKDGHKKESKKVSWDGLLKNVNSGKWGITIPTKGAIGAKQDKGARAERRKKLGLRKAPGTPDAKNESTVIYYQVPINEGKADATALIGKEHKHKDGDTYSFDRARYADGKLLMTTKGKDGFKSSPATLADYHGGKWTNREKGYVMSHAQALKLHASAQKGHRGGLFGDKLHDEDGRDIEESAADLKGVDLIHGKTGGSSYQVVAKIGGDVVGMVDYDVKGNKLIPDLVSVKTEHRRKGIGSALYKHALSKHPGKSWDNGDEQTSDGKAFRAGFHESEDLDEAAPPEFAGKDYSASQWAMQMAKLRESKPSDMKKAFGSNGPTPEQETAHKSKIKAWEKLFRYASKMQKETLAKEQAEDHEKKTQAASGRQSIHAQVKIEGDKPIKEQKSAGHICFADDYEYLLKGHDVYRASRTDVLDVRDGNRAGRWESSKEHWEKNKADTLKHYKHVVMGESPVDVESGLFEARLKTPTVKRTTLSKKNIESKHSGLTAELERYTFDDDTKHFNLKVTHTASGLVLANLGGEEFSEKSVPHAVKYFEQHYGFTDWTKGAKELQAVKGLGQDAARIQRQWDNAVVREGMDEAAPATPPFKTEEEAKAILAKIKTDVKAEHVNGYAHTLGNHTGIYISVSLDAKDKWSNGIFENSRHFKMAIEDDGKMEVLTSHPRVKFRKTYGKNAADIIAKIQKCVDSMTTTESVSEARVKKLKAGDAVKLVRKNVAPSLASTIKEYYWFNNGKVVKITGKGDDARVAVVWPDKEVKYFDYNCLVSPDAAEESAELHGVILTEAQQLIVDDMFPPKSFSLFESVNEHVDVPALIEERGPIPKGEMEPLKKVYTTWLNQGNSFRPSTPVRTTEDLDSFAYEVGLDISGPIFVKIKPQTDELYTFENSAMNEVIEEIDRFWERKANYDELGLMHTRGVMMYGPPGTGKSSALQQVVEMMTTRGDVVFFAKHVEAIQAGLRAFREIEPDRRVVVAFEEAEQMCCGYNERAFLQLLDGDSKINNVLYLGTTNYIDQISERILRPGRFDKKVFIGTPNDKGRRAYLNAKLKKKKLAEDDVIEDLVKKTDGMSFGHLRELLVGAYALGEDRESVLKRLRERREVMAARTYKQTGTMSEAIQIENEWLPKWAIDRVRTKNEFSEAELHTLYSAKLATYEISFEDWKKKHFDKLV